ncbi:LPS translocon maturation chaperone LptM [Thiomicrospira pelophila]|uniref:LPS translocon maturation chaperone LptM n=1 Tax=Thiomicrospira pelophila TaxID=934 RepID=UPI0004A76377|nr:lipoprotein [Thiomicrospira pelophila]
MKRKPLMSLELKPFLFAVSLLVMAFVLSGCGKKGPLNLPQASQIDTSFNAPNHSTRQPS